MEFDTIYDMCLYFYETVSSLTPVSQTVKVHGENIPFHFYKVPDDYCFDTQEKVTNMFSLCLSNDTAMQVLLCRNVSIGSGVTLTPRYRCKGLLIFNLGVLTNNGVISMTSRGCSAAGQNIYLYLDKDEKYQYVPKQGAAGGASFKVSGQGATKVGNNGSNGTARRTGGGGTGAARNWWYSATVGRGGYGTSYSGGAGSGAAESDGSNGWAVTSGAGSDTGGAGSNGVSGAKNASGYACVMLGGQGNGYGSYAAYRVTVNSYYSTVYGTGGLMIIFTNTLVNNGNIQSNGGNTMTVSAKSQSSYSVASSAGGASGGGSINIFYSTEIQQGTITANGGLQLSATRVGGRGGNGCVTISTCSLALTTRKNSNYYKDCIPHTIFDFNKLNLYS